MSRVILRMDEWWARRWTTSRVRSLAFWAMALLVLAAQVTSAAEKVTSSHTPPAEVSSLAATESLIDSWQPPLSTRGRYIVDASGRRFHIRAGNLHGASGTYTGSGRYEDATNHHAGEVAYQTILGLDRKPLEAIVDDVLALGINTVRLPFSNEMLHDTRPIPDRALGNANPELRNLTPMQVFDRVVEALTRRGLAVILNNHTVKSLWCCGPDVNARWDGAQSTEDWIRDWVTMVSRYAHNPRVVGAALYNEVRRDLVRDPTWGGGGDRDWFTASMRAANEIQRSASPDILIIIEGINWVGVPVPLLPHWRPELSQFRSLSPALSIQDKLVASAHFYAYTGPNSTGLKLGPDPSYAQLTPSKMREVFHSLAGFVASPHDAVQRHFTAPVWISEFGVGGRNEYSQTSRRWWRNFARILVEGSYDFAVWPLVGWHESGQGDLWALNAYDSDGARLSISDKGDWRLPSWRELVGAGQRDPRSFSSSSPPPSQSEMYRSSSSSTIDHGQDVPPVDTWRMLAPDWDSQQQSNWLYRHKPRQPGNRRASCPDGLRLIALSRSEHPRALCTDAVYGRELWSPSRGHNASGEEDAIVIVTAQGAKGFQRSSGSDENIGEDGEVVDDWAPGHVKLQCPESSYLTGYSYDESKSASAACARMAYDPAMGQKLSSGGNEKWKTHSSVKVGRRTVWFGSDTYDAPMSSNKADEILPSSSGNGATDKGEVAAASSSNGDDSDHGAFALPGDATGHCRDDEIAVGYAFSSSSSEIADGGPSSNSHVDDDDDDSDSRSRSRGKPSAILCQYYRPSPHTPPL